MPMILVEACGEPDGFERRVQHDPALAGDLLAACEESAAVLLAVRDLLARVHDGYPEVVAEIDARVARLRAAVERAKGPEARP